MGMRTRSADVLRPRAETPGDSADVRRAEVAPGLARRGWFKM
jgi:hypothetical protein